MQTDTLFQPTIAIAMFAILVKPKDYRYLLRVFQRKFTFHKYFNKDKYIKEIYTRLI